MEMEQNDQRLIERFLKGDNDAYAVLYKKYARILFSYGSGFNITPANLEDAVQDVFYQVLIKREQLRGVTNIKYFLIFALRNRLIDILRKTTSKEFLENVDSEYSVHITILDDLIEKEEQIKLQKRIEKLLNHLTVRQKEAIYLRYTQCLEYEEIAKILNMTPHSAQKLVSRAILKMRGDAITILIILSYTKMYIQ